jgi:hypothetical protein
MSTATPFQDEIRPWGGNNLPIGVEENLPMARTLVNFIPIEHLHSMNIDAPSTKFDAFCNLLSSLPFEELKTCLRPLTIHSRVVVVLSEYSAVVWSIGMRQIWFQSRKSMEFQV